MSLFPAVAVAFALLLPWAAGVLWLRILWPASAPGRWPLLLGYGYLLGLVSVALVLRAQSAATLPLWIWPALLLSAVAASFALLIMRRRVAVPSLASPPHAERPMTPLQRLLFMLLLGWLILRFAGLALELWWQPVYPWDAWTTWVLRARVWVEAGSLVPFVSAEEWLRDAEGLSYSIEAWHYPKIVSLLAAWPALAYGGWHDTVAMLPWLGCALALGLGFYGQARLWGASALTALAFTWLLASLPMLDTHVALAGYADLWLTTALGLAMAAFLQWVRTGDRRQALLALLTIGLLPLLKQEGLVWALLFLPALLVALTRRYGLAMLAALGVGLAATVLATGGIGFELGGLGHLWIGTDRIELPLLGAYPLELRGTWTPVVRHLFLYDNWHLLMYLLPVALLAAAVRAVRGRAEAWVLAGLVWTVSAFAALYLLFFWTDAYRWAEQATSINRVVMHFTAGWLFWMMGLWLSLAPDASRAPDGVPPAPARQV
jgi:hypothetical protein